MVYAVWQTPFISDVNCHENAGDSVSIPIGFTVFSHFRFLIKKAIKTPTFRVDFMAIFYHSYILLSMNNGKYERIIHFYFYGTNCPYKITVYSFRRVYILKKSFLHVFLQKPCFLLSFLKPNRKKQNEKTCCFYFHSNP